MRSIGHAKRRSNTNLRGRKTLVAGCGCCVWQDFREDYARKLADEYAEDCLNEFDSNATPRRSGLFRA
jgi:hypothetical protein